MRRRFALVTMLLLACSGVATRPPPTRIDLAAASVSPPAAAVPQVALRETKDPCAAIAKVTADRLAGLDSDAVVTFKQGADYGDDAQCIPDAGAPAKAWGIVAREVDAGTDTVSYGLARYEPEFGLVVAPLNTVAMTSHATFAPLVSYDFDDDGTPEIFVKTSYAHEGALAAAVGIHSFVKRSIVPYAKAKGLSFNEIEDSDDDGRLDLTFSPTLDGGANCGSDLPNDAEGPPFLLHSVRGGGFVADDAAAREFIKAWCPKRPAAVTSAAEVACRRVYGDSTKSLTAFIRKSYKPLDCARELAGKKQRPNAREDFEHMLSAAAISPPFELKSP